MSGERRRSVEEETRSRNGKWLNASVWLTPSPSLVPIFRPPVQTTSQLPNRRALEP